MRSLVCWPIILFCLVITAGCSSQSSEEDYAEVVTKEYGHLTRARRSTSVELQEALDRIEEHGGTPAQLDSDPPNAQSNAAVALAGLFSPQGIERLDKESFELLPQGQFTFDPLQLEKVIRFRRMHDGARLDARAGYDRPECHFGLMHKAGFFADTSFVEVVRICGRLEAFQAAECLANNDLAGTVEALDYMLRGAEALAGEQHVICRIEAARLRRVALSVIEALVHHRDLDTNSLAKAHALLAGQLERWPSDARAWIGDRALGMHTYEAIRGGDMIWLLTDREVQQLVEEMSLSVFEAAALRGIDADEVFYLQSMQDLIKACELPFFQRREVFVRVALRLSELENSPEYPLVAGRMLLRDVERGQQIQAEDRAACEAWCIALALAAGKSPPPFQVNPLSGKPYEVELLPGQTIVASEGAPADPWYAAIVVPWPDRTQHSASRDKARVQ